MTSSTRDELIKRPRKREEIERTCEMLLNKRKLGLGTLKPNIRAVCSIFTPLYSSI